MGLRPTVVTVGTATETGRNSNTKGAQISSNRRKKGGKILISSVSRRGEALEERAGAGDAAGETGAYRMQQ